MAIRRIFHRTLVWVVLAITVSGCALLNIPTKGDVPLATVDLNRVYGGWYIVAGMPNRLERGLVGSYDVFSPGRRPGRIHEDYYMQNGGFDRKKSHISAEPIEVLPNSGNADWRVHLGPVSLPFQIVYVDPEYRFILFGEQNRKWGWVYSRTQTISDSDLQILLGKFRQLGWDTSPFLRTVQTPDQIGKPGFWSDGVSNNKVETEK